jgi:murein DD-endopeptidase MepM/ murein hydrolase activator NlpD
VKTLRRHVRRATRHRTLLVGPVLLGCALAAGGHALPGPAPVVAAAPDRPDRVTQTRRNAVARPIPAAPARASRSQARTAPPRVTASGWTRPAYGPLTSPFGYRWGRLHPGIDIGAPYGAPIYAAAAGVVTYVGPESGYGRLVTIRHADGTVTAYGHMSRYACSTGQRVSAGQLIAYVGAAGDATGPHLHFEVRVGDRPIDPRPYLASRGVWI